MALPAVLGEAQRWWEPRLLGTGWAAKGFGPWMGQKSVLVRLYPTTCVQVVKS